MTKSALTIGGSDPSSGAGIQADLKAFSVIGVHGCSVITCVTAQNTKKLHGIYDIPLEHIEKQLDTVLEDIKIDACKTGMLYSPKIVELTAEKLSNAEFPLIVDPVLSATVGGKLHAQGFVSALIEYLIPNATVVTPNIPEAEAIVNSLNKGLVIKNLEDMKLACETIHDLGCRYVYIKGGHLKQDNVLDILFNGVDFHIYMSKRIKKQIHGGGCTHSALITALMAEGNGVEDAIESAKYLISDAIIHSQSVGKGLDVTNLSQLSYSSLNHDPMTLEIEVACAELIRILPLSWVPEVGINIGYAKPDSKSITDIYALEGRIMRADDRIICLGKVQLGASRHISRIILTCMTFDRSMRSAMNIKYKAKIVEICEKIGFKAGYFDRKDEPDSVSTMEWGTEKVIKNLGFIPDIIYDLGGTGKEAMIRILGRDPSDLLKKLEAIIEEGGKGVSTKIYETFMRQ